MSGFPFGQSNSGGGFSTFGFGSSFSPTASAFGSSFSSPASSASPFRSSSSATASPFGASSPSFGFGASTPSQSGTSSSVTGSAPSPFGASSSAAASAPSLFGASPAASTPASSAATSTTTGLFSGFASSAPAAGTPISQNPEVSPGIFSQDKGMAGETANKELFFGGLLKALKEQWLVDIRLKPGDNDNVFPAHKVVLAARSKVFRNMLESDECKDSSDETITLSELKHEELETFLEFLYDGSLPVEKLKQHVRPLYLAADKYEIPYLQDLCRNHLIASLGSSNALDVLELSNIPSDKTLNDAVTEFITKHLEEIAFLDEFNSFVERNSSLAVQTIRAFLNKTKDERTKWQSYQSARQR